MQKLFKGGAFEGYFLQTTKLPCKMDRKEENPRILMKNFEIF